jgi:ABC-2 type transport system ATP-binding protein
MGSAIETVGLTRVFQVRKDDPASSRRIFRKKGRLDSIVAVDNVNLKIRTGEFFGLLGPNGAGKSAFVRMLSTVLTPTRGTAYVNGYDVRKEDLEVRKQLGVVIASGWNVLYQRLSGWDNLDFYGALYGIPKAKRIERSKFLLDYLGIGERAHDQVQKASTGMQRRLVLCKTLLPDSPILLLDEPTVGLDVDTTRKFGELLKKISREQQKTILLTTHHMSEAERLCDRVAILKKGKIVACDTPDQLRGKTGEQNLENAYVTIVGNT